MKTWSSWEIIRHQVAICGRVVDERGGKVCGVRVNIVSMPEVLTNRVSALASATEKKWDYLDERLDRTLTRADGIFYFLGLPAGQYTLSFDANTDWQHEKKVVVIWDIFPAVRDATKGKIMTPYRLTPHVSFQITGDTHVEYQVKGQ